MTNPTASSDGFVRWQARDWAESLCTELPDGTWLVQAPIGGAQVPRPHILRDGVAKDRYLVRVRNLIRRRAAWRALEVPGLLMGPSIIMLGNFASMLGNYAAIGRLELVAGITVLLILMLGIGEAIAQKRFFRWLSHHANQPLPGSHYPPIVMWTAEQWEAVYRWDRRAERVANCVALGMIGAVIGFQALTWLHHCHGIGMLDAMIPALPDWRGRLYLATCAERPRFMLSHLAVLLSIMAALVGLRWYRRRKGMALLAASAG